MDLNDLRKTLSGEKYKQTMAKISELRKSVSEANAFRLSSVVSEAERFFSELKAGSPEIFEITKIQRKEIVQLAIKKRTGLSVIID